MTDNASGPGNPGEGEDNAPRWWERRRWAVAELGPWEHKEVLRARISELEAVLDAVAVRAATDPERSDVASTYQEQARHELGEALKALEHPHQAMRGAAHLGVAQSHVDAAQNLIIWLASPEDIMAMLPQLVALTEEHFPSRDPRRVRVKQIAKHVESTGELKLSQRAFLAETASLARRILRKETLRVRSFVRIVIAVTATMLLIALGLAFAGFKWPDMVPLCFTPENGSKFMIVCPTESRGNIVGQPDTNQIGATAQAQDYLVIEIVGAVSAAVASAAALRRIRGTALPYNVPLVLSALKLPTGALTALLGLVLMRGGFVPGLSALDSSAQIIAWAIILGYAQQLFTKFVDIHGQALLDAVHGPNTPQDDGDENP